jgi:hypothetical protein
MFNMMIPASIKAQPQKAKAIYTNITKARYHNSSFVISSAAGGSIPACPGYVYGGYYEKQFNRKTLSTASGFFPRRNNDDAGDNQRIKT